MSSSRHPGAAQGRVARRGLRRVLVVVLSAVAVVMFGLGVFGWLVRGDSYQFAVRYGQPVQLVGTSSCVVVSSNSSDTSWKNCQASWRVNGDVVEGKLLAATTDALKGQQTTIHAFGGTAYTEGYGKTIGADSYWRFGLVPAWVMLALPLLLGWAAVRFALRRRRSAAPLLR